jgi:hypothetical protein
MMTTHTAAPPTNEYRTRIERELAARLAERARPDGGAAPAGLLCLACRAINPPDAHFCTACGSRFNALVVNRAAKP